jgi:multiple sugar transport system permease protein
MILKRSDLSGYLFVLPSLLLYLAFFLFPVLSGIGLSFLHYKPLGASKWASLANYSAVLRDPTFWLSVRNTAVYSSFVVAGNLGLSLCVAVLIYALPQSFQSVFKATYYLPVVTSAVVVALIWRWIYNPAYGLLNYLLAMVGAPPVYWLGMPSTALASLVFMTIVMGDGAAILLILASLGTIPPELYESATCDGAGRFTQFRRISLPLLRPILLYLSVMMTIQALQVFVPVFTMTRGGPNFSTITVAYMIYYAAFVQFMDFGTASAQGMILFALTLILSIIQFRLLRSEVVF